MYLILIVAINLKILIIMGLYGYIGTIKSVHNNKYLLLMKIYIQIEINMV